MKVNGKEISQRVIDACVSRMKENDFRAMDIEGICTRMNIEWKNGDAMRTADRIIQRERKAGNVALARRPYWIWVGEA